MNFLCIQDRNATSRQKTTIKPHFLPSRNLPIQLHSLLFTLFFGAFVFTPVLNAQIAFVPRAGLNFGTMSVVDSDGGASPLTLISYQVGLTGDVRVNEQFSFLPGLILSSKGSKYNIDRNEFSINPLFIEIPLSLALKSNLGAGKLLIFGGPYIGFGIGGSIRIGTVSVDIEYGTGNDKVMKSFDYGINFGTGFEYKSLQFTVQYGLGLANLAPVPEGELKIRTIGVSLGYIFGGK